MSLTNLLKSTGGVISSAKNQYGDIERMFQGYAHNPYITQPSEMYDNAYYPGYMWVDLSLNMFYAFWTANQ